MMMNKLGKVEVMFTNGHAQIMQNTKELFLTSPRFLCSSVSSS